MAYSKKSFLEHVAIRVRDIDWHIRFFREVFGMTPYRANGPENAPEKVWTIGGMQFNADPEFSGPEGRTDHLGIMVDDLEEVLQEAQKWEGVKTLPQGRHWLALPDGLVLELMEARTGSVAEALAVKLRP